MLESQRDVKGAAVIDYHVLAILGALIALDVISGIMQAVANRSLSSQKMRAGIYHKGAYVLVIALAALLEYGQVYIDFGITVPLVGPSCAYIGTTEALSILENVCKMNPDIRKSPLFNLLGQNQNRRKDD